MDDDSRITATIDVKGIDLRIDLPRSMGVVGEDMVVIVGDSDDDGNDDFKETEAGEKEEEDDTFLLSATAKSPWSLVNTARPLGNPCKCVLELSIPVEVVELEIEEAEETERMDVSDGVGDDIIRDRLVSELPTTIPKYPFLSLLVVVVVLLLLLLLLLPMSRVRS